MHVRFATIADVEEIAGIHVASWQSAYRGLLPDRLLDKLDVSERRERWNTILSAAGSPVLVAEDDAGHVNGFCSLCASRDRDRDPQQTAEIAALYVAPGAWRQGFGTVLCSRALAELQRAGYREATLWVLTPNSRARRFYATQGFERDEGTKVDAASGVEEVRYVKSIQRR